MIDNILVIKILSAVLILQQIFWMYTIQRLVNKLMSRSYLEVVQADKLKSQRPKPKVVVEDMVDDYAAHQADKANKLLSL